MSEEIKREDYTANVNTYIEETAITKVPEKTDEAKIFLINSIDRGVGLYNTMMGTEASADDVNKTFAHIKGLEEKYNSLSKNEKMKDLKGKRNTMMSAIKSPFYPTVRVRNGKKDDPTIKTENVERRINLIELNKLCGKDGMGKDTSWITKQKGLWLHFIARGIYDKLPDDVGEEIAKKALTDFSDCDFMKNMKEELTSNGKLEIALKQLITAMVGEEFKPKMKDVRYIMQAVCKRSNKAGKENENTITYVKEKGFSDLILDVLRRIVCSVEYKDDYKVKTAK